MGCFIPADKRRHFELQQIRNAFHFHCKKKRNLINFFFKTRTLLMVLKLINNTLTLFFGENSCNTETGVGISLRDTDWKCNTCKTLMKINCVIKRLKRLFSKHLSRWFKHCYHHYFHYTRNYLTLLYYCYDICSQIVLFCWPSMQ